GAGGIGVAADVVGAAGEGGPHRVRARSRGCARQGCARGGFAGVVCEGRSYSFQLRGGGVIHAGDYTSNRSSGRVGSAVVGAAFVGDTDGWGGLADGEG